MSYDRLRPALEIRNLSKSYLGEEVLKRVSLDILPRSVTVITGPSGSGKTTFLNMMSTIDTPNSGTIHMGSVEVTALSQKAKEAYRARNGQVFQQSGLLNGLTAEENIYIPHNLSRTDVDESWVRHLTDELGVTDVLAKKTTQLSGGQMQRIGIVRALAHRPELIFADEPTASLDTDSKHEVYKLFRTVVDHSDATVVMVSHDDDSNGYADVRINLKNGEFS